MVSLMIYIVYAYIHCIKSYFVHHYALKTPNLMGKKEESVKSDVQYLIYLMPDKLYFHIYIIIVMKNIKMIFYHIKIHTTVHNIWSTVILLIQLDYLGGY